MKSEYKKSKKLDDIFDDDPFKLLDVQANEKQQTKSEGDRLIESFAEISSFYEENTHEPEAKGIYEFKLHSRLKAIRADPQKVKTLKEYDFYGLLQGDDIKTVDVFDIIDDDPHGLLDTSSSENEIFSLKHVKKSERIRPDYLARRKICASFSDYEGGFNLIHEELRSGKRKLIQFDKSALKTGKYFALNGVLLLLEKKNAEESTYNYDSGFRTRTDGRTRCIFDNGTESTMLLRSLIKALDIDGFGISDPLQNAEIDVEITEEDIHNGFIYVLRSKSTHPKVSSLKHLYKIGYSTVDVSSRVKNSKKEPTYLFAEVEVVAIYRCFNLNTHILENAIHSFFNDVRLDIEIKDSRGMPHRPREWFSVPLKIIDEVVGILVAGEIGRYYYDTSTGQVIIKAPQD